MSHSTELDNPDSKQHWRRWPITELLVLAASGGGGGRRRAAAAGTAGITYFAVIGFGFGVLLVVNTLVSQSFGRKDLPATGRYLWQGIWFAVVFGLLTLLLYPRAEALFQWMGHEPLMAKYEADYF